MNANASPSVSVPCARRRARGNGDAGRIRKVARRPPQNAGDNRKILWFGVIASGCGSAYICRQGTQLAFDRFSIGTRRVCRTKGVDRGEVRQKGRQESRARDARAQTRDAQERTLRQASDEPQAGDRDWLVGSARGRRKGTPEARGEEGVVAETQRQEI